MWAARARESFLPADVSIVFRHQPYNMGATDEEKRKFRGAGVRKDLRRYDTHGPDIRAGLAQPAYFHLGFLDPAFPFLTPAPGQDIIGIGATPHSARPVDLR
jgi:hypothetical protein